MKTRCSFLLVLLLTAQQLLPEATAQNDARLKTYLRKSLPWMSPTLHRAIALDIYYQGTPTRWEESSVIVYLKNKAWELIGQEDDFSILSDYIGKRFIVITLDYGNDPKAISPFFDKDLNTLFRSVYGYQTASLLKDLNLTPKEYRCFFLPQGYRVATDLVYWDLARYGAFGTLDYIMESYNNDIVPKVPGLKRVSDPMDMIDREGRPFDFTLKMDIVYPSRPRRKVPVIVHSETLSARNPNERPHNYNPYFAGFLARGYAYAIMAHCFNPCVNHYFHFGKFTLDHWNGYACYTAAIRFLNAHAGEYGLNPLHIGMIGYSKGEYAVTRLSDPHHDGGAESETYDGFPPGSPEPQPWPGYPSTISAGMQGMGMGLFETEYITADYVPNIIICGEHDREVITTQHAVFVKRLEELDANHLGLFMTGQGHELPWGYDSVMGVDRYQLVTDFFDRYLRVEEKLPPAVLLVSPFDQQHDIPVSTPIYVHFAPVIDQESVLKNDGIKVVRAKDGRKLEGQWKVSHGGTRFTFTPAKPLDHHEKYRIVITRKIKDRQGTQLEREKVVAFTTSDGSTG
jgi:hypothetical protein